MLERQGREGRKSMVKTGSRVSDSGLWHLGSGELGLGKEKGEREKERKKPRCLEQGPRPDDSPPPEWFHPGTWASGTGPTLLFLLVVELVVLQYHELDYLLCVSLLCQQPPMIGKSFSCCA